MPLCPGCNNQTGRLWPINRKFLCITCFKIEQATEGEVEQCPLEQNIIRSEAPVGDTNGSAVAEVKTDNQIHPTVREAARVLGQAGGGKARADKVSPEARQRMSKGAKARQVRLTSAERSANARKAVNARWAKNPKIGARFLDKGNQKMSGTLDRYREEVTAAELLVERAQAKLLEAKHRFQVATDIYNDLLQV